MTLDANKRLALKLALVAVLMFGFGYAMVPFYDVFCKVTGINGKTGQISNREAQLETVDTDRFVTVEFDTNVNSRLPWKFRPLQRRLKVNPPTSRLMAPIDPRKMVRVWVMSAAVSSRRAR